MGFLQPGTALVCKRTIILHYEKKGQFYSCADGILFFIYLALPFLLQGSEVLLKGRADLAQQLHQ